METYSTHAMIRAYIASRSRPSAKYREALEYRLGKLAPYLPDALPTTPEPLELALSLLSVGDETHLMIYQAWRNLYAWAAGRYGVPNPMLQVARPPTRRKIAKHFTEAQIAHLIYVHMRKPELKRDLALILLMLDNGARLGEVAGLTWEHIGADYVILQGKTGQRKAPISPATSRQLQLLGANAQDGAVWYGRAAPLTIHGLQTLIKRCIRRAGLKGGPHKLRHTFGRLYMDDHGNLHHLMQIMGHTSIKTTERYLRESIEAAKDDHADHSPVARLTRTNHQPQLRVVDKT